MLAGDSFWIALGWLDTVLYRMGPSPLQAVRIFWIASGTHSCKLVDHCFGQSDCVWTALDIHFRKLAGNCLRFHWAFSSATWLAIALNCTVSMLAGKSFWIALGITSCRLVRNRLEIALGIHLCRLSGNCFGSH
jgi:hypothetical protein